MVCNKIRISCFENSLYFSSNGQGGIVTVDKEPERADVIGQLCRAHLKQAGGDSNEDFRTGQMTDEIGNQCGCAIDVRRQIA